MNRPTRLLERTRQKPMIRLTRLGGEPFILNAELIRYVESRPDTFITLTCGDRLVVAESMDEVLERTVRYQQSKHLVPRPAPLPTALAGATAAPATR